jgi:hypothetical protein
MNLVAERDHLRQRLERGWRLISDAEAAGRDVAAMERYWLALLRDYEAVCRTVDAQDNRAPRERHAS